MVHDTAAPLREIEQELGAGSDRAVGILAGAFVEEHLTDAITVWMVQDDTVQKEMFSPGRALGDFGNKINLGYLMYLYSSVARKELDTIRFIRNAFAHKLGINDFEQQQIRDRCNNLIQWEDIHILLSRTGPTHFELRMGSKLLERAEHSESVNFVWSAFPTTPRERYIAACKFYIAAFSIQIKSAIIHPRPAGFSF